MEKPHPVPGRGPGFDPPSYSSLFGSQSQADDSLPPVPPAPTTPPYPVSPVSTEPSYSVQMPMYRDTVTYNPMSQVTFGNGKPMPQPYYNLTFAPTTCDPVADVPGTSREAQPIQTMIVSSQLADSNSSTRRCRCCKVFSSIVVLIVIVVGIREFKNSLYRRTERHERKVDSSKESQLQDWLAKNHKALERRSVDSISYKISPGWQSGYNDRHRRMAGAKDTKDFKDYDFFDLNDKLLFDEFIEPEKSYRQRRDVTTKNKFGKKKNEPGTRERRIYKAKKIFS